LVGDSSIAKAIQKEFKMLKSSDSAKYLSKAFTKHTHVLVDYSDGKYAVCESKHLLKTFLNSK
jgi:hypothetical protein